MYNIFACNQYNLCYVPIPKNASIWGEHFFGNNLGFTKELYRYTSDKKYIIILREPYDRWITGICEYLYTLSNNYNEINELFSNNCILDPLHFELIFSKISLDIHTMNQISYLQQYYPNLSPKQCVYFYFNDENLMNNIQNFLNKFFTVEVNNKIFNKLEDSNLKQTLKNQFLVLLEKNHRYKELLQNHLKPDYLFLKRCRFYNSYKAYNEPNKFIYRT